MDDVWIVRGPGGYREVLGDVMEADDVNVNVMMVVVMVEVYEYASVRHRIRHRIRHHIRHRSYRHSRRRILPLE